MKYFFTADQHYGHSNIIKYCDRPFSSVEEMDQVLIDNHNSVVNPEDRVIHVGDLSLKGFHVVDKKYIKKLNGNHIFIRGSHDYWMGSHYHEIWEGKINRTYVVACHYAMRVWPRSHYNSWHIYGHSHGKLKPYGKSHDVGVDNNNYFPVSFDELAVTMSERENNFNFIKKA